jgi:hypothetical protein
LGKESFLYLEFELILILRLYSVDILWAIVKCTAPALPLPLKYLKYVMEHPDLTIYPCDLSEMDLVGLPGPSNFQSLGYRFDHSTWAASLDQPLKITIRNFCNLIIHYETDKLRPERERIVTYTDNNPWNLSQRYLLTLSYEHLGPDDIREPLRRSMLAYSMTRYCNFGAFPCMDAIAGTLKESLVPRLGILYSTAPDLLFWVLFVGALVARQTSGHYQWHCAHLAHVSSTLGLIAWSDARSILQEFFYIDRPWDNSVERIWQSILSQTASNVEAGLPEAARQVVLFDK